MKNFLIISISLISSFAGLMTDSENLKVAASSTEDTSTYYARIMYDGVYLYKNAIDSDIYSNVYFELPKTYFVMLLGSENSSFFKVQYLDFTGYVKKDNVQAVAGTPSKPYLDNISFRVYAELSRDMRSEPTTSNGSSSQVIYLPLYSYNLTYYGCISGATLVDERTDIWYFCKYSADQDYYGYVYSDFCDKMTTISNNTEEVTYIDYPDFSASTATTEASSSLDIDDSATGIIIAVLIVPAIIFLFLIIKSGTLLKKEKSSAKEVRDY